MKRFENDNVYDEDGMFLFSYYECGIKSGMSNKKKNEFVEKREDYLSQQIDEDSFLNGEFC